MQLHDFSFDGFDLSGEMLKVLEDKGRKDIYRSVFKQDLTQVPWAVASKSYDCTVCSGVLIYVNEPDVLEEFVRVTKKGGHCCIMFREDGYSTYEEKDEQLQAAGKWKLISKSAPERNFPSAPADSPSG